MRSWLEVITLFYDHVVDDDVDRLVFLQLQIFSNLRHQIADFEVIWHDVFDFGEIAKLAVLDLVDQDGHHVGMLLKDFFGSLFSLLERLALELVHYCIFNQPPVNPTGDLFRVD